jgi:hypothetical protein
MEITMSYIRERNAHLDKIDIAVVTAKLGFLGADRSPDRQQAIIATLMQTICDEITGLVEVVTGDADYLGGHADKMIDDMKLCFADATERVGAPISRRAPYGVAYDNARGA